MRLLFLLIFSLLYSCVGDSPPIKIDVSYQAIEYIKEKVEDNHYNVKYLTVMKVENSKNEPFILYIKSLDNYILVLDNKKYKMFYHGSDSIIINSKSSKELTLQTILTEKYTLSDIPKLKQSLYQSKVISIKSNQEIPRSVQYQVYDFDSSPVFYKHEF